MTRGIAIAAALALAGTAPCGAETSRSFEVAASVVAGCLIATDAGGRWGNADLGSVPGVAGTSVEAAVISTAGAGLSIECTPGVSASLAADNGDHAAGGERYLMRAGGTATIRYRLYANGGTAPWAASTLPLVFTAGPRVVPLRAVATLAGPAAAGTYTDTIHVTLGW